MAKTVAIGLQSFEDIRKNDVFYVDKTHFIKEWWENYDAVTLITRPRRFGKTLNMDMLNCFFSNRYADRGDLFEGLSIWDEEKYRELQGTYPVIFLSFAAVKDADFEGMGYTICKLISDLYESNRYLLEGDLLSENEKEYFKSINTKMSLKVAENAINSLTNFMSRYYQKKVIVLIDEYDTPMQEAWIGGYWDQAVTFFRSLFSSAFKTNPYLERGVITGITRISKESIFSDLNHLKVVTVSSDAYADCFGFTEEEVFQALDEYGLSDQKQEVKEWYDGFIFGTHADIYNPWSIINYLDERKLAGYWVNTSSNGLVNTLMREGDAETKMIVEDLIRGKSFQAKIDEQIVFSQLQDSNDAVWSLLLASGYLKVLKVSREITDDMTKEDADNAEDVYELALTNLEVRRMMRRMVRDWFRTSDKSYNYFIKSLLANDVEGMNEFMNNVALDTFSSFDTGKKSSKTEPERFYHGFVLGLMVDLSDRYVLTSNRESGYGRYDIMLEPRNKEDNAYIIEFKVHKPGTGKSLEDTVASAQQQIADKKYDALLVEKGIPQDKIYRYGFAFEGKTVLIG